MAGFQPALKRNGVLFRWALPIAIDYRSFRASLFSPCSIFHSLVHFALPMLFPFTCSTRFGVENVAVFRLSPNRFASLGVIYL
ncbi:MAG: hypothetical protein LBG15_06905, partial [Dysgonamonadaceae bacterium]|nr:hypothetical protein [Dysgonamonadaceae bacterium]